MRALRRPTLHGTAPPHRGVVCLTQSFVSRDASDLAFRAGGSARSEEHSVGGVALGLAARQPVGRPTLPGMFRDLVISRE